MKKIIIEEAKQSELSAILDLYALPDMDCGEVLSLSEASAIFEKINHYPDYKIYVAKENGKVIGTFSLLIVENIIHQGHSSGLVESVVVHTNYRSLGIGKKMMEYAIQKCKEANCHKMSLSSRTIRERAHSFYERLGFKKHGYSFMIEL
jgi:ribosomal protein S18 acetylase RimI-like enzyme